ncbi:phosphoserine phosphatase SerB [Psychrobacter pygoscelis]|uniref:phosphoserine phosphatase SerB n=1 Tax=Psychrobacter pygoscelis TaxID=2488563 RepID=UPI00103F0EFD|nr:phosphoserine phosphatase SerB [Psychrobacter pygoscelis]
MPKNTPYSLPKDSKAWQQALDSVASLLPSNVTSEDLDTLQSLPIFALIVVLPKAETDPTTKVQKYIQAWVDDQPSWQLVTVADDADAARISLPEADFDNDSAITDVTVLRYLLIPTTATLMHPEKKTAAAHIIDEQLTTRLRRKLTEHQQATATANTSLTPLEVVDCHILSVGHMLRPHKLACFDMDSTLIEQEVIDELARAAGIGEEVAQITESAMRGEIDFDESFAKRLSLLEGLSTEVLDDICAQLTLSKGAKFTLSALKALGYHTVLVSGGFSYFAQRVAEQLGIDEIHANKLDIEDGKVTGYPQLPIVNGERKAMLTGKTAEHLGIAMTQVVCIGDGANDLPMMAEADLGIAYQAKPIVQARADAAINVTGLEGVLYALGYPAPSRENS